MKGRAKQPAIAPPVWRQLEAPDFAGALMRWFAREGRMLPWRNDPAPYRVVVSEFMLQQTQVTTVIPYFEKWMRRFPDWKTLATASEPEVLAAWEGLGYYSRARNLHRLAGIVAAEGEISTEPLRIRALPGVGDYAAGAIAAFAFDLPEPAVDANVARVLVRLLDWHAPVDRPGTMGVLRNIARAIIPHGAARAFNGALMELGALVCVARNPRCVICPVRAFCVAREPGKLPVKAPRRAAIEMDESALWCLEQGKLALAACPGNARWRGMWRLPEGGTGVAIAEIDFPFTHHRIHLRVFQAGAAELPAGIQWVEIATLPSLPIPAPHRRIIDRLLRDQPARAIS